MRLISGREDEDTYVEPYTSSEWIYIGDLEESHVWKRPDSRDGDDEVAESVAKERRGSQESTESERNFRKKYQATTQRIVHRKISGEMYKRIQTKCFGELLDCVFLLFRLQRNSRTSFIKCCEEIPCFWFHTLQHIVANAWELLANVYSVTMKLSYIMWCLRVYKFPVFININL